MSKTVKERKLDTRAARARLKSRAKPYKRTIDVGLHIGYRRGLHGGAWVGFLYQGDGTYKTETLAIADDHGQGLDYYQAVRVVKEWAAKAAAPVKGALTVGQAMASYFDRLERRGSKSLTDARNRTARHVLPSFGETRVEDLSSDMIEEWHAALGGNRRAGKATANRVLAILRAALNQSFRDGKTASDSAWRRVRPFKNVDEKRLRFLTRDESIRLVNAAQGAFRDLIRAALFSGCRRGELAQLRCGDYDPDSGTIFISESKSGRTRRVILTDEGQRFFATLTAGKSTDALMLVRENGQPWGRTDHVRPTREALAGARISGASFHSLRHTNASLMAQASVPLSIIAGNLGHSTTRMTERYAHLSPSAAAESIRRCEPLGLPEDSNLVPMRGTK